MGGKYPGVTIRGNAIQITFTLKGERIRKTIRCGRIPTNADLRKASELRSSIYRKMDLGTFNYEETFPHTNTTRKDRVGTPKTSTVEFALNAWLKNSERRLEKSTLRDYRSIVDHHLIPNFGDQLITEIQVNDVREWLNCLTISNKRINNVLIPLREIFKEAYLEGFLSTNPMQRIPNLKVHSREPAPFSELEIRKIISALHGPERNLIQFAFYSGMRTSELVGLKWKDVCLTTRRAFVRHAVVRGAEKRPKTSSGVRTIELHDLAIKALEAQRSIAICSLEEVFYDPKTCLRWSSDQPIRKRVWTPALVRANVTYREQYQTRHTYASMMLCEGKNPLWVAQQMGHRDWGMIRKTYGRWIPSD